MMETFTWRSLIMRQYRLAPLVLLCLGVLLAGCKPATPPAASSPTGLPSTPAKHVDTSKATVHVVAFYPGNDDDPEHLAMRKLMADLPARYGGKVSAEFVDFTSDEGYKRWQDAGLNCGAVLINGQQTYTYIKDGKPNEVTFMQAQGGEWTLADLDAVIKQLLKAKK